MLLDASGDVDLDRLFGAHAPVALTFGTGVTDHAALARAAGARRDRHELPEHRARGAPHLAGPATRLAGDGVRRRLRPGSAARGAAVQGAQPHGLGGAARHLVERELQRDLQVLPPVALAAGPLAAAEEGVEPAQSAEVAHEDVERLGEIEMREAEPPSAGAAAHARHTVAIVGGALLGIAQHLVRFRDLLEFLFGGRLLPGGDAVRVVLHGEATVGLLDVRFARIPRHAQKGVVVGPATHSSSSPTRRLVWSTSATILSYGIRVGPSTPITPDSAPIR